MSGRVRGVGIDIEHVARWREPDLRLFTDAEARYCLAQARPEESFAGHWCAKEAIVKACWPVARLGLRDVEISHGAGGEPIARILPPQHAHLQVLVSIAHDGALATAIAQLIDSD